GTKRRPFEMSFGDRVFLPGIDFVNANLFTTTLKGNRLSIRREFRCIVARPIVGDARFAVRREVVKEEMRGTVAVRDIYKPAAVGRPRDLAFFRRRGSNAGRLSTI